MADSQLGVGSWYWERLTGALESRGIVVMCSWMLSKRRYLAPYTRLYGSCGWDTLVCQPQMFNLFFPSRGAPLAHAVLIELAKEIERRPRPMVFATFSGGHRGCLHKILQILQGRQDGMNFDPVKRDMLRRCAVGQIYDSSPVDFVTEMGSIFVTHQVLTFKAGRPIAVMDWIGNIVAKALDIVFHPQLEPERVELWRTFYSSAILGPILILCSDDDELSPVETMHKCRNHLLQLGANADVISWEKSEHVGHLRHHPEEYKAAVRELLSTAASLYTGRLRYMQEVEGSNQNPISTATTVNLSQPGLAQLAVTDAVCSPLPENLETEILRISNLPHIRGLRRKSKKPGVLTPCFILMVFIGLCFCWVLHGFMISYSYSFTGLSSTS